MFPVSHSGRQTPPPRSDRPLSALQTRLNGVIQSLPSMDRYSRLSSVKASLAQDDFSRVCNQAEKLLDKWDSGPYVPPAEAKQQRKHKSSKVEIGNTEESLQHCVKSEVQKAYLHRDRELFEIRNQLDFLIKSQPSTLRESTTKPASAAFAEITSQPSKWASPSGTEDVVIPRQVLSKLMDRAEAPRPIIHPYIPDRVQRDDQEGQVRPISQLQRGSSSAVAPPPGSDWPVLLWKSQHELSQETARLAEAVQNLRTQFQTTITDTQVEMQKRLNEFIFEQRAAMEQFQQSTMTQLQQITKELNTVLGQNTERSVAGLATGGPNMAPPEAQPTGTGQVPSRSDDLIVSLQRLRERVDGASVRAKQLPLHIDDLGRNTRNPSQLPTNPIRAANDPPKPFDDFHNPYQLLWESVSDPLKSRTVDRIVERSSESKGQSLIEEARFSDDPINQMSALAERLSLVEGPKHSPTKPSAMGQSFDQPSNASLHRSVLDGRSLLSGASVLKMSPGKSEKLNRPDMTMTTTRGNTSLLDSISQKLDAMEESATFSLSTYPPLQRSVLEKASPNKSQQVAVSFLATQMASPVSNETPALTSGPSHRPELSWQSETSTSTFNDIKQSPDPMPQPFSSPSVLVATFVNDSDVGFKQGDVSGESTDGKSRGEIPATAQSPTSKMDQIKGIPKGGPVAQKFRKMFTEDEYGSEDGDEDGREDDPPRLEDLNDALNLTEKSEDADEFDF